jgi:hypothetical protein
MLRSTLSALVRADDETLARLVAPGDDKDDGDEPAPTSPSPSPVVSSTTSTKNTVPMPHPPLIDSMPLSEAAPRALRPHELMEWRTRLGYV